MSGIHSISVATGSLDLLQGVARLTGGDVALTPIDVAALTVLAEAMPEPVSERELLQKAWGYKSTKTRTVSVGLSRLRGKIEEDPRSPQILVTVRGLGYRLVAVEAEAPSAPTRTTSCLGRGPDQAQLRGMVASGERVVEVIGPGGIGKSVLVASVADEAVWVSLRGVTSAASLLRRLCASLGVEGANPDEGLRSALRAGKGLVLDGAESLDAGARKRLPEWVDEAPVVWITSREPLGLGSRCMLGPLDATDARRLVALCRAQMGLDPAPDAAFDGVLATIGGHPLALSLAAPLLELLPSGEALLALASGGTTVGEVLEQTLGLLPVESRELLNLAAVCATPPTLNRLQTLSCLALPELLRCLHQLRERGLVRLTEGVVEVPAFVQRVAGGSGARLTHARWAAAQLADPVSLAEVRHELELALDHADADALAPLLLRHIIVLHSYGPADRLREDVMRLVPQISDSGRREVVLGALMEAVGEKTAAYDAFLRSLDLLAPSDSTFRGWAWLWLSIAASWRKEPRPAGQVPAEALLALRGAVDDVALWASMSINAASLIDRANPVGAAALYAEVSGHSASLPSLALTAGFYRLGASAPSGTAVRVVEQLLASVGEERLGRRRWVQHHLRLGRAYLRVSDVERGMTLLDAFADEAIQFNPHIGYNTLSMAAAHVLDRPEVARRLLSQVGGDDPWKTALLWLLGGGAGVPPVDDEAFSALLLDVRDGRMVQAAPPFVAFGRAMELLQRRGYRTARPKE